MLRMIVAAILSVLLAPFGGSHSFDNTSAGQVGSPGVSPTLATSSTGQAYYIDNRAGSHCADGNAGTSPTAPWCDFVSVNARQFGPGDQILLARGASWDEELDLAGSGVVGNEIVVGAYGQGPRPSIIRNGQSGDRAIRMTNPSSWVVGDLELGDAGAGILVYYTTLFHQDLAFNDLFLHDFRGIHQGDRFTQPSTSSPTTGDTSCATTDGIWNSAGIEFTGNVSFHSTDYALKGVRVANVEGTHNLDSISFDWCNAAGLVDGTDGNNLVQDVVLTHLFLHQDDGGWGNLAQDAAQASPPAQGCDEGLCLSDMRNVLMTDSILDGEGGCRSVTGTAAIIFGNLENVNLINDIIEAVPDTNSADQTGVDYEYQTDRANIRDCFVANSAGAGVELLAIHGSADHSTNNELTGNLFVDNGQSYVGFVNGFRSGVDRIGSSMVPTGVIRDNLYVEPTGFIYGDVVPVAVRRAGRRCSTSLWRRSR